MELLGYRMAVIVDDCILEILNSEIIWGQTITISEFDSVCSDTANKRRVTSEIGTYFCIPSSINLNPLISCF